MDHKTFLDILNIARENARNNPSIVEADTLSVAQRYLREIVSEVEEVRKELKENNEVYLKDELSDIAWDYATLLSVLELRALIPSAEEVLEHAHRKYTERAPAFLEKTPDRWEAIKEKQKAELEQKHKEKYGI